MTDAKHTPRPWRIGPLQEIIAAIPKNDPEGGFAIAEVYGDFGIDPSRDPEAHANARLIAAAPDLLAACKEVLRCACLPDSWAEPVRAAIAKAEGHSP